MRVAPISGPLTYFSLFLRYTEDTGDETDASPAPEIVLHPRKLPDYWYGDSDQEGRMQLRSDDTDNTLK